MVLRCLVLAAVLGLVLQGFRLIVDLAFKTKTQDHHSKPDHRVRPTLNVQRIDKTYVT